MPIPEEYVLLIADDDAQLCMSIGRYLTGAGFKTVLAYDGAEALELLFKVHPQVAIVDLKMPKLDGLELLATARSRQNTTPFIITTAHPDMESAIAAIHNGAFDYIVKPFHVEVLHQKITKAIETTRLTQENAVLTELVSLHEITGKLTASHNLDELLDSIYTLSLETVRATAGVILMHEKGRSELQPIRPAGVMPVFMQQLQEQGLDSAIARWVVRNRTSILLTDGKVFPDAASAELPLHALDGSVLCVPLEIQKKVQGVILLHRGKEQAAFSFVDLNVLDVLSVQAGIALNNANLYASITQKLDELSLISTYAEQLMGLIEEADVIQCLFKTVMKYFALDVIAFLLIRKRSHELVYWSRTVLAEAQLQSMYSALVRGFNARAHVRINPRRVTMRPLQAPLTDAAALPGNFEFQHLIPLIDELDFGAVSFGAFVRPENETEIVALISSLINQTRIALINSRLYSDMKENYIRTIKALAIAVDAKDTYTHGHSENVMNIAEELAIEMKVDEHLTDVIRNAGLLHDIGKIGVPGTVLNKTGPLTYDEFNGYMKSHSMLGANIVKDVPFLQELYELILYHHEHFSGGGYPEGLKGNKIPLGARIIHVADAFEAMTSDRPYRKSLGTSEAVKRLQEERGAQFDPEVVDAFLCIAMRKGWITAQG